MVTQMVMPISGNAGFAKYCQTDLTVGCVRPPPIEDLQNTAKARGVLVGRIKTGTKTTMRHQVGQSFQPLHPRTKQPRRQHDFGGKPRGLYVLQPLNFQLKKSAILREQDVLLTCLTALDRYTALQTVHGQLYLLIRTLLAQCDHWKDLSTEVALPEDVR
jgi:hypothetical protein